jgi:hypothetical protein
MIFIDNVDKLINLKKDCNYDYASVNNIIQNPNLLFLVPVTKEEVQKVTKREIFCRL